MMIVSISQQTLIHRRSNGVSVCYAISTAAKGSGNLSGSLQTPLGKHRIALKIGAGEALNTAFVGRQPVGIYDAETDDRDKDWILTRILWLSGCRTGFNRRGRVDSFARYIYIHGTHREDLIGQPASHGCIRMRNRDVMDLFDHAHESESIYIRA